MHTVRRRIAGQQPAADGRSVKATRRFSRQPAIFVVTAIVVVVTAITVIQVAELVSSFFSDPKLVLRVLCLRNVLVAGAGAAICYALWTFWLFVRPRILARQQRAARRQRFERNRQIPADELAKHLKRGEIPYLIDDGEILFENKPQYTSQPHQDDGNL
jgi:hypothetical protein